MKKIVILSLGLALSFSLSAQKGVEDGSKYGHGEDSINCIKNLSLYQTYAKQNDYKTALEFWEIAYRECPASSINLYIEGAKIRKWQIRQEKDPAKKMEYFNLLMQVYDQRIQYFGTYSRAPRPSVLGLKAVDYFTVHPDGENSDKAPAYEWLKVCVEESAPNQFNPAYAPYFMIASRAMLDEPGHKTQFFADYLKIMEMLDAAMASARDQAAKDKIKDYENSVDDVLVKSGVADCSTLQDIFQAELETNKTNIDWLRKVVNLFKRVKCTDTEVYFAASENLHRIEPTAESAEGCAYMCIKKEDYTKAAEYLKEAVNLCSDDDKKADYEYTAAQALFAGQRYAEARSHALAAASLRSGFADPYILIAKMYANSVDKFDDKIVGRVVYCAAVDKLEKAKSVDPSVAESCNDLIGKYREQFPRSEDVFMHPDLNDGSSYRLGSWINESTVVRAKK